MPTCMKPYFGIIQLFECYLKSIGPLKTLSAEDERKLFREYWSGNEDAFNILFFNSQYIVIEEVLYFKNEICELQDLLQEANLGCIEALQNYQENGGNLKNYLHQNIYRQLDNYSKTYDSPIRLPMNVKTEIDEIRQEINEYHSSINEDSTFNDFENYFLDQEYKIEYIKFFFDDKFQIYFDEFINRVDLDLDNFEPDFYDSPDQSLILESLKEDISILLTTLDERDAEMLILYFGLSIGKSYTLEAIGDKYDLTRERVRQILRNTINQLKHTYRKEWLSDYLSLLFYKKERPLKENYYFKTIYEDDEHITSLLEKYIQPRRRITAYPHIKNLSKECRNQIINILDKLGRPLTSEEIIDLILERFPLLNKNIINYSLRTIQDISKIDRNHYALKKWEYLEVIKPQKVELFDNRKLKKEIISILNNQEVPMSYKYLLSKLGAKYNKTQFSEKEEQKILRVIKRCENIIRTLDSKYYYLGEGLNG